MRSVINIIALSLLLISCTSESETLDPFDKDGSQWHYRTHGIQFSADQKYSVIQSTDTNNPFITVLSPDQDTIIITASTYPRLIDPFREILDTASWERKNYLEKLAKNNHILSWEQEVLVETYSEERMKQKRRRMTLLIEDLGDRYVWARMPRNGKEGEIDIIVESKNRDRKTKVNVWAFTKNCSGDEEIMKLAKTVQIE